MQRNHRNCVVGTLSILFLLTTLNTVSTFSLSSTNGAKNSETVENVPNQKPNVSNAISSSSSDANKSPAASTPLPAFQSPSQPQTFTQSPTPSTTISKAARAVDDNHTVMSLLHLTSSVIGAADDVNRTIQKVEKLLTKNGTLEHLATLPDPWSIDDIAPKLVFYHNKIGELELPYKMNPKEMAIKLYEKGFLDTRRLILITHGFHNNFNAPWLTAFKNDILNISSVMKFDQTVALIGWGGGADLLVFRYRQAAANVLTVGKWLSDIARAIKDLSVRDNPSLNIYGVGHSLGAHVMGIAGRQSNVFNRITGLDPAGPCFEKVDNSQTLHYKDANFVDVIHTDGYDSKLDPSEWIFPVNHYGSLVPIGTIDFYPNFGFHQPNAGAFTVAGSHLRALDLFQWSILNPEKFLTSAILKGVPDYDDPVEKWMPSKHTVEMGYYADRHPVPPGNCTNTATLFYIKTNGQTPWI